MTGFDNTGFGPLVDVSFSQVCEALLSIKEMSPLLRSQYVRLRPELVALLYESALALVFAALPRIARCRRGVMLGREAHSIPTFISITLKTPKGTSAPVFAKNGSV